MTTHLLCDHSWTRTRITGPYKLRKVHFQKTMLTEILCCISSYCRARTRFKSQGHLWGTGRCVTGISMTDGGCSTAQKKGEEKWHSRKTHVPGAALDTIFPGSPFLIPGTPRSRRHDLHLTKERNGYRELKIHCANRCHGQQALESVFKLKSA